MYYDIGDCFCLNLIFGKREGTVVVIAEKEYECYEISIPDDSMPTALQTS